MISAFAPLERFHFTCSADILVCGFWRLSSRQFIVENTGLESLRRIMNGTALIHRRFVQCQPPRQNHERAKRQSSENVGLGISRRVWPYQEESAEQDSTDEPTQVRKHIRIWTCAEQRKKHRPHNESPERILQFLGGASPEGNRLCSQQSNTAHDHSRRTEAAMFREDHPCREISTCAGEVRCQQTDTGAEASHRQAKQDESQTCVHRKMSHVGVQKNGRKNPPPFSMRN